MAPSGRAILLWLIVLKPLKEGEAPIALAARYYYHTGSTSEGMRFGPYLMASLRETMRSVRLKRSVAPSKRAILLWFIVLKPFKN